MGRFFGRNDIESRLRDERPAPPDELLSSLTSEVAASSSRAPRSRTRYGLAAGLAGALVVVFAIVGGGALLGGSSATATTVAVPAKAVPTIRAVQAHGARLAVAPVRSTAGSKLEGVKVDTSKPTSTKATSAKVVVRSSTRQALTRYPAASVYVPGTYTLMCLVIQAPPDTIYINLLVPVTSLPYFLSTYPGSHVGPC